MTITPDDPIEPEPQDRSSFLARTRARREEIKDAQWIELDIPRWDDPLIKVRYGPLDHSKIRAQARGAKKARDKAAGELRAQENMLVMACLGVFGVDDNDKPVSLHPNGPDEDWTKFDPDLAEAMGLPTTSTARDVLRFFYLEDGDVFAHSNRVVAFSGYEATDADEELLGE